MRNTIRTLLIALALGTSSAYAQSAYDSGQSKYDSHSAEGNSANWGVGT
jgi:hypothetical protein